MRTSISLEETDIKKMLDQIIKHHNKENLVSLLTSVICDSTLSVEWFTKCFIGNELPEIYADGTIVNINIEGLNYDVDKEATIKSNLNIGHNQILGTVHSFRGFNNYAPYIVKCKFINKSGNEVTETQHVSMDTIEVIKEF